MDVMSKFTAGSPAMPSQARAHVLEPCAHLGSIRLMRMCSPICSMGTSSPVIGDTTMPPAFPLLHPHSADRQCCADDTLPLHPFN